MSLGNFCWRDTFEFIPGKEWNWQEGGQFSIMSDDCFQESLVSQTTWILGLYCKLPKGMSPHGNCYNYFYNIGICKLFRVQGIKSWEGGWKDINSEVQQMENASSIVEMSNYSHYIHCMVGKIITEMKGVLCVQTSQWPLIRMGLIFIHIH